MFDPPYPRTKIDVDIAIMIVLVIPNSSASWEVAGAIMEDETGDRKVKADTMAVAIHFFLYDQLETTLRTNLQGR